MPYLITGVVKFAGYFLFALTYFRLSRQHVRRSLSRDVTGHVSEDRFCASCDYNLRGLQPAGTCPECGNRYEETLIEQPARETKAEVPNLIAFSLIRTVIGLVMGSMYWSVFGDSGRSEIPLVWLGLAPIRYVEWLTVIGLYRKSFDCRPSNIASTALLGTIWSYLLDLPVILGFCVTFGVPC